MDTKTFFCFCFRDLSLSNFLFSLKVHIFVLFQFQFTSLYLSSPDRNLFFETYFIFFFPGKMKMSLNFSFNLCFKTKKRKNYTKIANILESNLFNSQKQSKKQKDAYSDNFNSEIKKAANCF